MTRNAVQSATALHLSPAEDRKKRMRAYSTAMSIRMACFILVFFVPGWWKLVFGVGAVVLPYVAVVLANAGSRIGTSAISPGLHMTPLALEQAPMPQQAGWYSSDRAEPSVPASAQPVWQHQE